MKYVFDTGPFITLFKNYYRATFVTLWENFDTLVAAGDIVLTREVFREIKGQEDNLLTWARRTRQYSQHRRPKKVRLWQGYMQSDISVRTLSKGSWFRAGMPRIRSSSPRRL